jgi:hypothetical protein
LPRSGAPGETYLEPVARRAGADEAGEVFD